MELAVVSVESAADGADGDALSKVAGRLGQRSWTHVYAGDDLMAPAERFASMIGAKAVQVQSIDLVRLAERHPGASVVALCRPDTTRALASAVMYVDDSHVLTPRPFSLTIVGAGRRGVRTLHSLNDTLHLSGEHASGAKQSAVGDETPALNVDGVPLS
jgi:hypothetical protein